MNSADTGCNAKKAVSSENGAYMARLSQKVALITGGGAGIGRATALLFAREGARTVIAEMNKDTGADTERAIRAQGGESIFIHTDVTQDHSVKNAVAEVKRWFGRIDILFNCAGGSDGGDNLIADIADLRGVWERTMPLNLYGTMLCCQCVIPEMVSAGEGAVINMSSGAALRGASPFHMYTSAKGGIVALTRALAGAYARNNVRVNAIAAGRAPTERTLKRHKGERQAGSAVDRHYAGDAARDYPFWIGEPIDIANIALFLASSESRMVTGATIPADGGRSAY